MPRISMGEGKSQTIKKFRNSKGSLLMCDLDKPSEEKENDLVQNDLVEFRDSVFYMIQEMESWFLSQPAILDEYYGVTKSGKKVSEKIIKKKSSEISEPKEFLKRITQDLNKGEEYQEIKHAVELLELLDATKLEDEFPDFKRLIEKLK